MSYKNITRYYTVLRKYFSDSINVDRKRFLKIIITIKCTFDGSLGRKQNIEYFDVVIIIIGIKLFWREYDFQIFNWKKK